MYSIVPGIFFIYLLGNSVSMAAETIDMQDETNRISYSLGHQIGIDYKRQNIELDEEAVTQGISDGYTNKAPKINPKEMKAALSELKRNISSKMKQDAIMRLEKRKEDERSKREEGKAFFLANKSKPGITTLESGLQYKILKQGSGAKPKLTDYVTYHYRARTLEGREYDSSFKKGKPVTKRTNSSIIGLTEAIQMMPTGSTWELYIPTDLAYGRQGPLAHQTVIVELELISINK